MSDLNDLIATNAINAFNNGVQTGIAQERKRIIELLIEEGVFCNGHWKHECSEPKNCDLTINGSWHGAGPCEWDFMGGNDCKQVIELIKEIKNANN